MKIFAVELSSRVSSLARVEDGRVTAEENWEEPGKERRRLFAELEKFQAEWETFDLFCVGRGPGAFSGMRIGFCLINALAAPLKTPVYALNSGAAVAALARGERTVVFGDARRGKVWAGIFSGTELEQPFMLMEYQALHGFIPSGARAVSPDRGLLQEKIGPFLPSEDPVFPTAGKLGELVFERLQKKITSEPFEPLYLHPPVFTAPRFPA